ncbi:MAG: hypothetical protein NUV69_02990 [Candidatus Curtissbacteria bacterium]|nr:hypothetical protein [Candidatus Curtissbacteria bacterium]
MAEKESGADARTTARSVEDLIAKEIDPSLPIKRGALKIHQMRHLQETVKGIPADETHSVSRSEAINILKRNIWYD